MATTDFIAAIELSSSKISGIAGKKNSDRSIQVLAYAREDASSFIHKGVIYNIDKTAQALTSITNKLENQLNNSIAKVYVGIGGQSLRTVRNAVSRTLEEESIISQESPYHAGEHQHRRGDAPVLPNQLHPDRSS